MTSDTEVGRPYTDEPVDVQRPWARRYRAFLTIGDAVAILAGVLLVEVAWFAGLRQDASPRLQLGDSVIGYTTLSVILALIWFIALEAVDSRDWRIIGAGPTEYKRAIDASILIFGVLAMVALVFHLSLARGYVLSALPVGVALIVANRWLWRQWLVARRRQGKALTRSLVVGSRESVEHIVSQLRRYPLAGYLPIGVAVAGSADDMVADLPVVASIDEIAGAVDEHRIECVVLTSSDELPPTRIKQISWDLELSNVEIVIAPALIDVAGPRIHTRPIAGLPLLHVEVPRYDGGKNLAKWSFDRVFAAVSILLFAPLLIAIAVAVRVSSDGPVLYRQIRVGRDGALFTILKFRSMMVDAERHTALLAPSNDGSGLLFKLKNDPRVTTVGRFLRRWSLDELPQLFNVLRGDMSIVGPRPPLPREVEAYDPHVRRRLLVRPGITGPWQVGGRSDLSWEDSVRLDLSYVENWSITGDVVILGRTLRAVFGGRGAY